MTCPNPSCRDGQIASEDWTQPPTGCTACGGAGRVPDVEATLRAEVAALRTQMQIVRLALASIFGQGHEERDLVGLAVSVVARDAELRGEVERLARREREVEGFTTDDDGYCVVCEALSAVCEQYPDQCIRAAWLAGCKP